MKRPVLLLLCVTALGCSEELPPPPSASCSVDTDCPKSDAGAQLSCCGGACVDTRRDPQSCGRCGTACLAPQHATAACVDGMCGVGSCAAGFLDCDKGAQNGCEVDGRSDARNCGACGTVCRAGDHQAASCEDGTCAAACAAGFADCDGNAGNGCEADTRSDARNCGACGTVCGGQNGSSSCRAGLCVVDACNPGFADCNGDGRDGCESELATDPAHCGACGNACTIANGVAACAMGACALASCNAGFADCDNLALTGCEIATASDVNNCGACGTVCQGPGSAQDCRSGSCQITQCDPGLADCDRKAGTGCEVKVQSDATNCGRCGNACPVPANGTPGCANGMCGIGQCTFGFFDCNGDPTDGCEVDLLTPQNCGLCGNVCRPLPNAMPGCKAGQCGVGACIGLFGDCDGNPGNGCERSVANDLANCGKCGAVCAFANAQAACLGGQCGLLSCNPGYADCDGNPANGCEVNLNSDGKNCGKCGNACPPNTQLCSAGNCIPYPAACSQDKDQSGAAYVICAMNNTGAWISGDKNAGVGCTYGALAVCRKYGFTRVTRWGGTCGTVCGYCGAGSCQNPQAPFALGGNYTTYDSGGGNPTNGANISCTVQWECAP